MRSESLNRLADLIRKDSLKAEKVFRNRARVTKRFEDRAFCRLCSKTVLLTPIYMVHAGVWYDEAGMQSNDFMHVDCLQEHLGRPLTVADFTEASCNLVIVWALKQ